MFEPVVLTGEFLKHCNWEELVAASSGYYEVTYDGRISNFPDGCKEGDKFVIVSKHGDNEWNTFAFFSRSLVIFFRRPSEYL